MCLADRRVDVVAQRRRLFDARAGARAHVNLELPRIHRWKEVLPQKRRQQRHRPHRENHKHDQEQLRMIHAQRQKPQIADANLLERALKPELEPHERIAAGLLSFAASASSCSCSRYRAMVGTTVRESR